MVITDAQLRAIVIAGGMARMLGIGAVRFCERVSPLPWLASAAILAIPMTGASDDLRAVLSALSLLARDAAATGLPRSTIEEMSRKLPFRMAEGRHVLEVGQRPIGVASLQRTRRARGRCARAGDPDARRERTSLAG